MRYKRREFLKAGGAAIACTCLGGLCLNSCSPFSSISNTAIAPSDSFRIENGQIVLDLEKTADLTEIGGSAKMEFLHPGDGTPSKIILVHPEDASYLAFANNCTHKGKELEYNHSSKKLKCVSGHSEFDMNGNVLKGNAEKSLKCYATERDGDTLIVRI
jgi:Rieske Fe-S protein